MAWKWSCLLAAAVLAPCSCLRLPPAEPPDLEDLDVGEEAEGFEDGDSVMESQGIAPLEWTITEVVAEALPTKPEMLPEPAEVAPEIKDTVLLREPRSAVPVRWVYGSHHKTGTVMLRHLAYDQANVTNMEYCFHMGFTGWYPKGCPVSRRTKARVWFHCDLSAMWLAQAVDKGVPLRVVHIVRDPIAMVISGYIYHQDNEDTPDQLKVERNMSMADALAVEARWVLESSGLMMLSTYLHSPPRETIHVRLESFMRSSESFDATSLRIFNFTVGDRLSRTQLNKLVKKASRHDLRRHPNYIGPPGHVAGANDTERIREAVRSLPAGLLWELRQMRKTLGYE